MIFHKDRKIGLGNRPLILDLRRPWEDHESSSPPTGRGFPDRNKPQFIALLDPGQTIGSNLSI